MYNKSFLRTEEPKPKKTTKQLIIHYVKDVWVSLIIFAVCGLLVFHSLYKTSQDSKVLTYLFSEMQNPANEARSELMVKNNKNVDFGTLVISPKNTPLIVNLININQEQCLITKNFLIRNFNLLTQTTVTFDNLPIVHRNQALSIDCTNAARLSILKIAQ